MQKRVKSGRVLKMGRIFENCSEAINEIERDIMEMGILVHPHSMQNKIVKDDENFSTLEIQNYTFSILEPKDRDEMVGENLDWCKAEFRERVFHYHVNPGEAWKLRAEVWTEFLNNGEFDYTYNERINEYNQLDLIIRELKENPDTRQACLMIHAAKDKLVMRKERIPCSVYYQFMIRRGAIDIIYNMRSSDFDTHFKNDIWQAIQLQHYVAECINKTPGLFHMNIGSLHRYKNYTKKHVF